MKTNIFLLVFMLVLPSQLTGITTTHHDKTEKTMPEAEEELAPASTSRINITERQRRLIPYMTFYLTRNLNRPSQQLQELREPPAQQYQVAPQKITIQPYHGKIILVNNQPKYNDQPAILYQQKIPYTPFLESNKLPGGFTPMRNPPHSQQPIRVQVINPNVQNNPPPASTKEPNFSFIFDKLLQLKQLQYNKPPQYTQMQPPERPKVTAQYFTRNYATPRPPTKFITVENYPPEPEVSYKPPPIKTVPTKYVTIENYPPEIQYKPPPPVKTAPKFIAIENIQPETNYKQQIPVKPAPTKYITLEEVNYKTAAPVKPTPTKFITVENYPPENIQPETRYKTPAPTKTYIHTYTPSNIDISNDNKIQNYENFESLKTYNQIPSPVPTKQQEYEPTPITVNIQNVPQYTKEPEYEQPNTQINDEKNYEPIIVRPLYRPNLVPVKNYAPIYQQQQSATVAPPQSYAPTENPHSLSVILKQLQDSNTLPQTLTPDNIDNSIKTLVHILNALKHTQKFQRPIVVAPSEDSSQQEENIDEYDEDVLPETVSHSFPAETPEGGTPGKPGIDYPAYSFIPQTNFNCKKQRYKGFFGDPDTNCQVWHYCDLNGGQASFLCPNGTIFSQVALTCDWWYNVKCATTTQLYVLNERLYKYILPFTPKFPEDYSGPLVDRYLALKFKEMEEKMKKQKKGKTEKATDEEPNSEVNNLQDIEDDHNEAVAESKKQEQTTHISEEEDKKSK